MGAMRMPPPKVVPLQTATACVSSTRSAGPPSGSTTRAAQAHAAAHDDAADGRLRVGDAAAEERRCGGRVPVHEAADAGREDVEPVPLDRPAVVAGEAREADVDGTLRSAGDGGQVRVDARRDAERAAEVGAGAGGHEAERRQARVGRRAAPARRSARGRPAALRRARRAGARRRPRSGCRRRPRSRPAAAARRPRPCRQPAWPRPGRVVGGHVEGAQRRAQRLEHVREVASRATAAGAGIDDDERRAARPAGRATGGRARLRRRGASVSTVCGMSRTVPDARPPVRPRAGIPPPAVRTGTRWQRPAPTTEDQHAARGRAHRGVQRRRVRHRHHAAQPRD